MKGRHVKCDKKVSSEYFRGRKQDSSSAEHKGLPNEDWRRLDKKTTGINTSFLAVGQGCTRTRLKNEANDPKVTQE